MSKGAVAHLLLVVLIVAGLAVFAAGATVSELQGSLARTEWAVVEMTGFPEDNVVEGHFDFTDDRFRWFDGTNHSSVMIDWDDEGFSVGCGGVAAVRDPICTR